MWCSERFGAMPNVWSDVVAGTDKRKPPRGEPGRRGNSLRDLTVVDYRIWAPGGSGGVRHGTAPVRTPHSASTARPTRWYGVGSAASGGAPRGLCDLVRSNTVTAPTTIFQKAPRRRGKLRLPPRRSSTPCRCFAVESSYPTAPGYSVVAITAFRPGPLRQHALHALRQILVTRRRQEARLRQPIADGTQCQPFVPQALCKLPGLLWRLLRPLASSIRLTLA